MHGLKLGGILVYFIGICFQDEPNVLDAEAKIWTAYGPKKMRWRDNKGEFHESTFNKSAGQLFYETFVKALKDYKGNNIRIVGHSLGNQMAIYLAYMVNNAVAKGCLPSNLMIKRLALLDPYWSVGGGKDYLNGKWTGEVCREYIKDLKNKNDQLNCIGPPLLRNYHL